MKSMASEEDYWGDWSLTQPARTDTQLPRYMPPAKRSPVWLAFFWLGCVALFVALMVMHGMGWL